MITTSAKAENGTITLQIKINGSKHIKMTEENADKLLLTAKNAVEARMEELHNDFERWEVKP